MKAKRIQKAVSRTVRRSVALPRQLVEAASAAAPPELRQNLNRLVTVALQEFAARRKARAFEEAMAQWPQIPRSGPNVRQLRKSSTSLMQTG